MGRPRFRHEVVGADPAIEQVIPATAEDLVTGPVAGQAVGTWAALKLVGTAAAHENVSP